MKHIETIQNPCLKQSLMHGGCGWGSSWLFLQTIFPCECGLSPIDLVVATAADRAAATVRRWENGESCAERALRMEIL